MTKRDFFRVIIKLFGLFQLLIVIFQGIPQFLQISQFSLGTPTMFYALIIFGLAIGIFVALIYKVDTVINWLKLDTGFDDDIIRFENFNSVQIIKLAIILMSGWLILTNLPILLYQSYEAFRGNATNDQVVGILDVFTPSAIDYYSFFQSGISVFLGYWMITNYAFLANWLDEKTTVVKD